MKTSAAPERLAEMTASTSSSARSLTVTVRAYPPPRFTFPLITGATTALFVPGSVPMPNAAVVTTSPLTVSVPAPVCTTPPMTLSAVTPSAAPTASLNPLRSSRPVPWTVIAACRSGSWFTQCSK